jgi:hypothetical protein
MADRVTVRVDQEIIDALDLFHAARATDFRSRQDALRHIVADWLATRGYLPSVASGAPTVFLPQNRDASTKM